LALTPGTSMRMQIASAVSQTSTAGVQAPASGVTSTSAASCKTEYSLPIRSVRRLNSIRSSPAAPTLFTSLFLMPKPRLTTAGARPHQRLQLCHEFGDVFKFEIHRREPDISHLVEFFEPAH